MNNNLLKYIVLLIFSIFHLQLSASEVNYIYKNNSVSKFNVKDIFFSNQNNDTFKKLSNLFLGKKEEADIIDFLTIGKYFSLTSELVNGDCFVTNESTKKSVKYTLKNISGSQIVIQNSSALSTSGKKLQFVFKNLNYSTLTPTSFKNDLGLFSPYFLPGKTLDINEEIVFTVELDYPINNSNNIVETLLEVRYGTSTPGVSISDNNTEESLVEKRIFYRNPTSAPSQLSKTINPNGLYTLQSALGLSNSDLNNKKFYKNNIEISPLDRISNNLVLTASDIAGYTYKTAYPSVSTCISPSAAITLSLMSSNDIPTPGSIGPTDSYVCHKGQVTINNISPGVKSTSLDNQIAYSWEFSYDGVAWNTVGDTQVGFGEVFNATNGSAITVSNLTKNIKLRRKVYEVGFPNRFSYTIPVEISILKPELLFSGKSNNAMSKTVNSLVSFPLFSVRNSSGQIDNAAKITVYDENNVLVGSNISNGVGNGSYKIPDRMFTTKGLYKYKIVYQESNASACTVEEYFNLYIYDAADCSIYTKKIFASVTAQSTFGVTNESLAVDEDLSTASTIVGMSLLGIGPNQKISFNPTKFKHANGTPYSTNEAPIKAGTKVVIKLGQEYSAAGLIGALSLYPINSSGERLATVGVGLEGALLDLLPADNVFEYTYIAPVDIWGIELYYGAVLALGSNYNIYGVYVNVDENITASSNHCFENVQVKGAKLPLASTIYNDVDTGLRVPLPADGILTLNNTVSDISWGVQDIGLGVASSLASVLYPYLAVDDSYQTYAIFNKTVAALNRQFLDIRFNQQGRQGDQIQILMSNSGIDILSLNLLANFKVQRYLGDVAVGPEINLNDTSLVKLSLLWFDGRRRAVLILPSDTPFDRVVLTYLSVVQVSLGDYTYIHDVSLVPQMFFDGVTDLTNTPTICAAEPLFIEKFESCTDYIMSLAYKDSNDNLIDIPQSNLLSESLLYTISGRDYYRFDFNKLYTEHNELYLKIQSF